MTVEPTFLEHLKFLLGENLDSYLHRPIAPGPIDPANIHHFASRDNTFFKPFFELTNSANLPVHSIFAGSASIVQPGVRVGKAGSDGTHFRTISRSIVTTVRPLSEFQQALTESNEFRAPIPAFAVYEGVEIVDDTAFSQYTEVWGFESASSNLNQQIRSQLDDFFDEIEQYLQGTNLQTVKVTMRGHTDTTGSEDFNLNLGLDRAKSVKDYLLPKLNLPDSNFIPIESLGESSPIVFPDLTEEQRAQNRAVEILVQFEESHHVDAGQHLGQSLDLFRLSLLTDEGYFVDPLDWLVSALIIQPDDPILVGRPKLAPRLFSGRTLRVSDQPGTDLHDVSSRRRSVEHFGTLHAALEIAEPADLILIDHDFPPISTMDNAGNPLRIRFPLTIMGKQTPTGQQPTTTLRSHEDDSPLFEIEPENEEARVLIERLGVELIHLTLRNGVNLSGGAMKCANVSNLRVRNCHFLENRARNAITGEGGAVALQRCGTTAFIDCVFDSNSALSGGAISVIAREGSHDGRLLVRRCRFADNGVTTFLSQLQISFGGAIHAVGCHGLIIEGSVFENNGADLGGAVYAELCKQIFVGERKISVLMEDHVRDQEQWNDTNTPSFSDLNPDCTFRSNSAYSSGGAIFLRHVGKALFDSILFSENAIQQRQGCGGAVAIQTLTGSSGLSFHTFDSCIFEKNTATYGGALSLLSPFSEALDQSWNQRLAQRWKESPYLHLLSPKSIQIFLLIDAELDASNGLEAAEGRLNSLAEQLGGQRLFFNLCSIRRSVFHGNTAARKGGAIHVTYSRASLDECRLSANEATEAGGACAALGKAEISSSQCSFLDNIANPGNIPDPSDPTEQRVGGGALLAGFPFGELQTKIDCHDSVFLRNQSAAQGGACLILNGAIACFRTVQFRDNQCATGGGAICCENATLLVEQQSEFINNTAVGTQNGDGGAVCFIAGFADESGAIVQNGLRRNRSIGEFHDPFRGSRLQIEESTLQQNQASGLGAALFVKQFLPGVVSPSTNEGDNGNRGRFITLRHIVLKQVSFSDNSASQAIADAGMNLSGSIISVINLRQPGWSAINRCDFKPMFQNVTIDWNQGAAVHLQNFSRSSSQTVPLPEWQITFQVQNSNAATKDLVVE